VDVACEAPLGKEWGDCLYRHDTACAKRLIEQALSALGGASKS
jgi:hypothetical protein